MPYVTPAPASMLLQGTRLTTRCNPTSINQAVGYCKDLKNCGQAQYRQRTQSATFYGNTTDAWGCVKYQQRCSFSHTSICYTATPDPVTVAEYNLMQAEMRNGLNGWGATPGIAPNYFFFTGDQHIAACP